MQRALALHREVVEAPVVAEVEEAEEVEEEEEVLIVVWSTKMEAKDLKVDELVEAAVGEEAEVKRKPSPTWTGVRRFC